MRRATLTVAAVAPDTRWTFLRLADADGPVGWGEATLARQGAALLEAADRLLPAALAGRASAPATLAEAAILSAYDHAAQDIAAQRDGMTLAERPGGARRDRVPLYANVNRRTRDRSPAGFAASARDALAQGFSALKIAPFDEASPARPDVAPGLARIAAVRDAVGDARLMVDCHWRLDVPTAERVIDEASGLGLHWVECPLPETPDAIPALRRLRARANARGLHLAGMEQGVGRAAFAPFLAAGAYDVMMPDVKYVGGIDEMLRLAEDMARAGIAFSPHNPSGPVAHAVSLHLAAAAPALDLLELQFDETPLFGALQREPLPAIADGAATLPARSGHGVALDPGRLAEIALSTWPAA